ncbi:hypothetical protein FRB96_004286 [Tulasnella sp. 330]|nr:hypothetical protein FRB96_004286 [Tulasnella sp. 330]KAG8889203.1 hypothetical protein FRB98_005396 [Tulasnella sp. 332]
MSVIAPPTPTLKDKVKAQIKKVTKRRSSHDGRVSTSSSSSSVCSHFYEHLPSSIDTNSTISPDECPAMLGERHSLPLPGTQRRTPSMK